MTDIPAGSIPVVTQSAPATKVRGYWGNVWNKLRYDPVTLFCMALIILVILSAIFAPWLSPMDPEKSSMANRLRPIGYKKYLLGTDEQGRDMLSRLLWGGRVSLMMGIVPVLFATTIGGAIGNQMLTLTVVLIPPICRVAETATSQVRTLDFVDAARASGASTVSILF